jgi:hypothetical protein|nr:hypothetical protein [Neorhizobium tomejilense]
MNIANNDPRDHVAPTPFREKIINYYQQTGVLPESATLIAAYYLAAFHRMGYPDMDVGPVLPGCADFGPEPSPRAIIEDHARRVRAANKTFPLDYLIEQGIAGARSDILSQAVDIFGRRGGSYLFAVAPFKGQAPKPSPSPATGLASPSRC